MTIHEKMTETNQTKCDIEELDTLVTKWHRFRDIGERYISVDIEGRGFTGRITGSMAETIAAILAADYRRQAVELAKEIGVEIE